MDTARGFGAQHHRGVGDFFGDGDGEWPGVGEVQVILGLLAVLPPGMVNGPGP